MRPSKNNCFDATPLWNHVEVISASKGGGGNRVWKCKYCNKTTTGSYSKVKAHLLKISNQNVAICKEISDEVYRQIKKEFDDAELQKKTIASSAKQKEDYVSLPEGSDLVQPKKRKGPLELSFNVIEREEADKECAMMFYTGMLSFNLARNPHFRKFCQKLANGNLGGYVPPRFDRLRTTLLGQCKSHVNKLLQPIRDSWVKKGASICSDGWQDSQSKPLINIMIASAAGPMFMKAVDASEVLTKDAEYLANGFIEVIEEIGDKNVVQVITDNASNYKAAGAIIEKKYPHIFWTPCVVHCLNLVIKSICEPTEKSPHYNECQWISKLVNQVNEINYFILNHGLSNTIFQRYADLRLLKVAETRFGSKIVMATRIHKLKDALESMVMDPDWKKFKVNGRTPIELKAREVRDLLVSDGWWDNLDYFLKFTKPMMNFLRAADEDSSVLHLVYDMWDTMIEEVKSIVFEHEDLDLHTGQSSFFDAIHNVIESRWNKSNTPLHCLAHSLVPKYYTKEWLQVGESNIRRVAPNEDEEVSINRNKCFQRFFPNPDDVKKAFQEYGMFSGSLGSFSEPHVMAAMSYEDPLSWWANYGSATPLLQSLAFKLLSQPASSSCCERNWSIFGSFQSVKRNRLTSKRLEDLVFIHNNLRLLSRKQKEYIEGPSKFWDIGGDNIDGESILEMAELSLDDPNLEAVAFDL